MVTQPLIDYIKTQLGQNVQSEAIKNALRAAGWQNEDIDSGFRAVETSTATLNLEVKPPTDDKRPVIDGRNLAAEKDWTIGRAADLQQDSGQTELKAEVQKPITQIEPAEQVNSAEKFPREKRLEEKNKQKKIFRFVLNVVFGVFLGVGLTLGLQFALDKLFVSQSSPSPSPSIRPSPLAISLSDAHYKNEELGIEILYPSGWSRDLDLEEAVSGVKSVFFESGDLANVLVEILPIDPLEKNVSLENVLERSLAETKASHPDFVSLGQTKFSVSDLPAYIVDGSYSFQEGLSLKMKVLQVVLINESREFYVNVTLAAKEEDWPDYRPVYERIIDGFKLTK